MAREGTPQHGLFESEHRFRLLVEGVTDYAIYMLDPRCRDQLERRRRAHQGLRAPPKSSASTSPDFLPPEDREAGLPERALETARDSRKFEAEGWRVRKDGTRFWATVVIDAIYEEGELIGFAKITRDITERAEGCRGPERERGQFRLLVERRHRLRDLHARPEGIVTNWNAGAQRIKGYLPEEIIGQHFSRFYSASDQRPGMPARALRLALENGRYEEEGWRVRKDGTFFWASVIIDPIRDDEDKLLGFAKITRDITERREAQQNLERIQRQLAQSQKLEALGPADRRRGARLQQSPDDYRGQSSRAEEDRGRRCQGSAGHSGD